jgi:hypothetical protein
MKPLFLPIAILLALSAVSNAEIITSGDAGATFATDMSVRLCGEAGVQAVYVCSGNVIQAVSSIPGEGSTFYKPDGRVIRCPVVAPADMGAECVQLRSPNICGNQSVCPGSQGSVTPPAPPQQPSEVQPESNESQPPSGNVTPQQQATQPGKNVTTIVPNVTAEGPTNQDIYVFAAVIGGMIVLAVLHYMYMKSRGSEL